MPQRKVCFCVGMFAVLFAISGQPTMAQTRIPMLPSVMDDYVAHAVTNLPEHFRNVAMVEADNTPGDNPISNAGATLGRVLFYDRQLSHNNSIACASCHTQETGFGDENQKSQGVNGETGRHSMALGNAKFYQNGRFFWDERAATLEDQVLMPIQDPIEMNLDLATLVSRLEGTPFYAQLFEDAFGTNEVTTDRIADAMAQFVRSMVTYESRYDTIFDAAGNPDLGQLTSDELRGWQIFHSGAGRCAQCHTTNAQVGDQAHNIGLDETDTDPGAGNGTFKTPSLRNVEVRGHYMHDGRFSTLEEVIDFYSTGVNQNNPNLDPVLQNFVPNFSQEDKDGLLAFMRALTDYNFLNDSKFADPFVFLCDIDNDGDCTIDDLNTLLAEGPVAGGVPVDPSNERYDMDGDGMLTNTDVEIWLLEAALVEGLASPYKRGDANLDGVVDGQDFIRWNNHKFGSSLAWSDGDFNGDGVVDGQDFISWNNNKFTTSLVQGVPEPTSGCLALLCVWTWMIWRRRPRP